MPAKSRGLVTDGVPMLIGFIAVLAAILGPVFARVR